ncbi:FAD-binding oxidoreductase [Aliiroseovarius lamellibrachiae]|uniref:FAD-binding oxidoreductase n=1 Tax=Aliiroseovarius lamellibrachiae TaxID=1924933 RepID=UPI001BE0F0CF|nr:FAD-binding oxidoreductase [Aliiroseovarius lamellibrachiae]MBT2129561.1 FAD-binding oxidoreductase [Aliiroseovarius lamellibrachiae]
MPLINELRAAIGTKHVLQDDDMARWRHDWIGKYENTPLAVLRPANTAEVSACVKLAHDSGTPVVPVSGNTGLAGGAHAPKDSLMLSLDRMNKIRDIRPDARLAIVEGGVVLETLHDAVGAQGLSFPMTFGAKGSAMIAGMLSTNAGGSNVLRYGNTRDLCLGIEVVLPDGEVLDLMSELHKDNSGYDLRDLFVGAEGTLGIITGAVLKLVPTPGAFATAMVAVPNLSDALSLLNKLQKITGGAVEAFEYMPAEYMAGLHRLFPDTRRVFDEDYGVNILLEIGATAPRDVAVGEDGALPIVSYLEEVLGDMLERETVLDAVIAQNETQRAEMWARREAAAEVSLSRTPAVNNDIALPLDKIDVFFTQMADVLNGLDAKAETLSVAHLGDGNIHYMVYPSDAALCDAVMEVVEENVLSLGGSFSAEHGIGLSKLPSMKRRKNPVALRVMRQLKAAMDPKGIMNPGKLIP